MKLSKQGHLHPLTPLLSSVLSSVCCARLAKSSLCVRLPARDRTARLVRCLRCLPTLATHLRSITCHRCTVHHASLTRYKQMHVQSLSKRRNLCPSCVCSRFKVQYQGCLSRSSPFITLRWVLLQHCCSRLAALTLAASCTMYRPRQCLRCAARPPPARPPPLRTPLILSTQGAPQGTARRPARPA